MHTAAKVIFVRLFRHSKHVHSHTILGWTVWTLLCFISVIIGVVLAVAVPIFSYLTGIIAALFAVWYTYGLAGFFWLFDTYHLKGGMDGIRRRPVGAVLAVATILVGAFICVAGTYVFVKESGSRSNLQSPKLTLLCSQFTSLTQQARSANRLSAE